MKPSDSRYKLKQKFTSLSLKDRLWSNFVARHTGKWSRLCSLPTTKCGHVAWWHESPKMTRDQDVTTGCPYHFIYKRLGATPIHILSRIGDDMTLVSTMPDVLLVPSRKTNISLLKVVGKMIQPSGTVRYVRKPREGPTTWETLKVWNLLLMVQKSG